MANPTRILFISGEVAPFAKQSEVADLVRLLPEKLQEEGSYETRIMMPRYGTISERRNRLHEVIRLSGTDVPMGKHKESLKVKVASIPGIRLQVYFMDNNRYFKRKGIYADKQGKEFEDNTERALFFARASLETIRNLGWGPDVVHAFGLMGTMISFLLRTEYADEPLFENVKVVFTPSDLALRHHVTASQAEALGLPLDEQLLDRDLNQVGASFADAVVYPPSEAPASDEDPQFTGDPDDVLKQASALYDQVLNTVPA